MQIIHLQLPWFGAMLIPFELFHHSAFSISVVNKESLMNFKNCQSMFVLPIASCAYQTMRGKS